MRSFLGCVIREGLLDLSPLDGWRPVAERVFDKPDDPDATRWHVAWFQVGEAALRDRLPALAAATLPHWYAHFWSGNDLCVILSGAAFWAKADDRATWQPFIEYGDRVGVERTWTESISTTAPAWVEQALDERLGPVTLEGRHIRLEPLRPHHALALYQAGQAPEIWEWLAVEFTGPQEAERFIATALAAEEAGKEMPFAVIWKETGEVVGSTRFMDIDPANKSTEIGWTWYNPRFWKTPVNPEAKLLLMQHAFERWGARRVWLKTDAKNLRSQAAMRKMGAQYEGTLRNHRFRRDGSMRDSVIFAVIDPEWPAVKSGLLQRLG